MSIKRNGRSVVASALLSGLLYSGVADAGSPGPPTNVQVSGGSCHIMVTWTPPAWNEATPIVYRIAYREVGKGWPPYGKGIPGARGGNSTVISGLPNGQYESTYAKCRRSRWRLAA